MSDTISRQAAIDICLQYCPDDDGTCSKNGDDLRNMLDEIEALPSARPEIIFCKDCIYSDIYPKGADNDMPLKCLGIRYGGVIPDWYCEHAERRADGQI